MKSNKEKLIEAAQEQAKKALENKALGTADNWINKIKTRVTQQMDTDSLEVCTTDHGGEFNIRENLVWSTVKIAKMTSSIKKYIKGEIPRSEFFESMINESSEIVSKIVQNFTSGTVYATSFLIGAPLPERVTEAIGLLAGTIAGKIFCVAFQPCVSFARKKEMMTRYNELHEFYQEMMIHLRRQREHFRQEVSFLFQQRQELAEMVFEMLEESKDVDEISKALNNLAVNVSGRGLRFGTYNEFEDFILNSNEELVL